MRGTKSGQEEGEEHKIRPRGRQIREEEEEKPNNKFMTDSLAYRSNSNSETKQSRVEG